MLGALDGDDSANEHVCCFILGQLISESMNLGNAATNRIFEDKNDGCWSWLKAA